ncbi:uncharacterized protein BcabD6B2_08410 [Babesia caballi]|uniref:Uncharacterized protein n=1 Tax=Babesia caballi TaxID=5871 RepID=A0AAV4LQM5_BABCB|nr:hypothetical protein, conserved [Babesia caballi]
MTNHECVEGAAIKALPLPLSPVLTTLPVQVRQPVVIEREAAEEDLGHFLISGVSSPIGGGGEAFGAHRDGGYEGLGKAFPTSFRFKRPIGFFNLGNMRFNCILLPNLDQQGGKLLA